MLVEIGENEVRITGNHSPHPVVITKDVFEYFNNDTELAFHTCKKLRSEGYTPKATGIYDMRDLNLTMINKEMDTRYQNRYWKYGTIYPSAYEYIRGYYRIDGDYAVFSGGTKVMLPNR